MATCFICMENFTNGLPYTITSTAMFALKKDISNNNNTNFKLEKEQIKFGICWMMRIYLQAK